MEQQIIAWIQQDPLRRDALQLAASLQLNDWCLAAGFVRNLAWDKIHGFKRSTPLNDIDLIYFDRNNFAVETDRRIEANLNSYLPWNWSVKNQARMHHKNGDGPYTSTADAMNRWPELETAIGARIDENGDIRLLAPFGAARLRAGTITRNPRCNDPGACSRRIIKKEWLKTWPQLRPDYGCTKILV